MSALTVSLDLAEGRRHYRHGDTIEARVVLESLQDWEVLYAEVVCFWRTSGRGTQNEGVVGLHRPARKGEMIGIGTVERTYTFALPPIPWTYRGRALKVDWYVGLYVRPAGAEATEVEIPIVVHGDPDPERWPTIDQITVGKDEA
jgi:hypothetical protein